MLFVLGLALFAGAARHASADTSIAGVREGGTLRINVPHADMQSLDPALSYDSGGWQVLAATCAKLVNFPDTARAPRLRPEVAAAMPRVSADGRTYTFTLRTGYRFNTGAPVTPASFVRAFERVLSPKMQSPGASYYMDIAGAGAYARGSARRIGGIATSGSTLTFRFAKPAPDFLARLSMHFACAVPQDHPIDAQGIDMTPTAGPYFVAERVPLRSVTLRRNPFYRGPRPHHVDEIAYTVNTSESANYLQIDRGEVDYAAGLLPSAAYAQIRERYGVNRGRYFVHAGLNLVYLTLNTSRPLFADAALRRAVNFAIDRRAFVRVAGADSGAVTDQILPPAMPGYRDVRVYPSTPNLARARQLADGRTGKAVVFAASIPDHRDKAVLIQRQLGAIGIDVEIKTVPPGVYLAKVQKRGEPFDITFGGWFADYADPATFIDVLLNGDRIQAEGNWNLSYFDDPEYNRKIAAASALTGTARLRAFARLDEELSRDAAPIVPLYNYNVREFVSERVGCYAYHPLWRTMNLAAVRLR
jgi:peptide/nickel transport system substrate-binding protein